MGSGGTLLRMKTSLLILFFVVFITISEGHNTRAMKKIIRRFKRLRSTALALMSELDKCNTTLTDVERLASVETRHENNVDALVVVDADFTGTQCGPFTLTSWTTNLDIRDTGNGADSANTFSGGTFTSPANGYYHICSFSRFRNTGNAMMSRFKLEVPELLLMEM